MIRTLALLVKAGKATPPDLFPDLPSYNRGLPMLSASPCAVGCTSCVDVCPTDAISIAHVPGGTFDVAIDRGLCIVCGRCEESCPTSTIVADRRTNVAVRSRDELVITRVTANSNRPAASQTKRSLQFQRSLHVRVVSTGDSASDLEVVASENPICDGARFGIHTVASPRFADALVVTGPVAHGMREPLQRCYDAMASPRFVVAVGASAISGGVFRGGYASAEGVDSLIHVDAYVPGNPPHPWSIIHGLMLIMGHKLLDTSR